MIKFICLGLLIVGSVLPQGKLFNKRLELFYEANAYTLTEEHERALERSYKAIISNKNLQLDSILVIGHASKEGRKRNNDSLSLTRSREVEHYMKQFDTTLLIKTYGLGSSQPNKDFPGKHDKEKDRRTEVWFYYQSLR